MWLEVVVAVVAGFAGGLLRGFVVRPLRGYRQARKDVAKDLIKYGDLLSNPGLGQSERMDEARRAFRDDAAEIRAVVEDIPAYAVWTQIFVPDQKSMERIEGRLMRISNSIHTGNAQMNDLDRSKVRVLLSLRNQ